MFYVEIKKADYDENFYKVEVMIKNVRIDLGSFDRKGLEEFYKEIEYAKEQMENLYGLGAEEDYDDE